MGIYKRYVGHLKAAKNITKDSLQLYKSYPSRDALPSIVNKRIADFEELEFYCALGYDKDDPKHLINTEGDGLFQFTTSSIKSIGSKNPKARMERQLTTVDYTLEIGYQLALDPSKNISRSRGYEAMMRAGKKKIDVEDNVFEDINVGVAV